MKTHRSMRIFADMCNLFSIGVRAGETFVARDIRRFVTQSREKSPGRFLRARLVRDLSLVDVRLGIINCFAVSVELC